MKVTERIADPPRTDRFAVLRLLNESLTAELVCVLRYRRHHFMARALNAQRIADEFLVHSDEELSHADLIAARIVQMGGEPDYSPTTLAQRSDADYVPASTVVDMIRENLLAEHIAIDGYRRLIEAVGEGDAITRRMLEGIISVEQAHAAELSDLLQGDMRI
ncbi:MAG TPA: ferritin-like domain-containing protein [Steroidobacteraceae bacterium]|jgi:bacterioferritin